MFTAIFNHTNPAVATAFKSPVISQAANTADHVAQAAMPAATSVIDSTALIIKPMLQAMLRPHQADQES